MMHYLDALVYPNMPPLLLVAAAAMVVAARYHGADWRRGFSRSARAVHSGVGDWLNALSNIWHRNDLFRLSD